LPNQRTHRAASAEPWQQSTPVTERPDNNAADVATAFALDPPRATRA
jgi:hypothetical protein